MIPMADLKQICDPGDLGWLIEYCEIQRYGKILEFSIHDEDWVAFMHVLPRLTPCKIHIELVVIHSERRVADILTKTIVDWVLRARRISEVQNQFFANKD